jgi:hypothetical protein
MYKLLAPLLLVLGLFLGSEQAHAQNCPPGVAQSAVCGLPSAISLQLSDSVWGFQFDQNPHTRQITIDQIINLPGSAVYVPFTGGSFTGAITVPGITVNGIVGGSPSFSGLVTFNGGINLGNAPTVTNPILTLPNASFSSLPPVASANLGMEYFDNTCLNGSESSGHGTGCLAHVSNTGVWVDTPYPPSYTVTIAGISMGLVPGASVPAQGNGNLIQTASGAVVSGHIPQYGSGGALVDSGVVCCSSGGGGGSTIAAGLVNQIPWYGATGNALSPLSFVANGMLGWSSAGVPQVSTTAPSGMTFPSPSLTNATLSGTTSQGTTSYTGKQTLAASTTSAASDNMPPGTAPTTPSNGDRWTTTTAFFGRINGATGGFAMTTNGGPLSGTLPVTLSAAGAIACPTCLTTSSGGALTPAAPIILNNSTVGLGKTTNILPINFDANFPIHNDTYYFPSTWPYTNGDVLSLEYWTGGTNSPSFVMSWAINGVNITNCFNITVSQAVNPNRASHGTATCSLSNNVIASGQPLTLVISGVVGNPASAYIGVVYDHSNP